MESQPQNPELKIDPETFTHVIYPLLTNDFKPVVN